PFPVLEREMTHDLSVLGRHYKTGTHVYLAFDEFQQDQKFSPERWIKGAHNPYRNVPFGTGQRMCLGRDLAQELLGEMLAGIFRTFAPERIRPYSNHLFSGRRNDGKDSFATTFYQLRVFARALKNSYRIGLKRKAELSKCPYAQKA
ncbi:MAG: cytochrome P450, partial [Proteobacteria bacterium]